MNKPFSPAGYVDILATAKSRGYHIRPIRDAFKNGAGSILLLRHDVDLSLWLALEMAELEHERGVTASYYILPHNDFYDPFSPAGRQSLSRLIELGHEIGLHCDTAVYPEEADTFRRAVRRDIEMLEDIVGCKVVSVSQHNPIDSRLVDLGDLIEVDAYSPRVREKYSYVSDSAMSWRATTPWDVLSSGRNLQFLAHPVWWMASGVTRQEKFRYLAENDASVRSASLFDMLSYIERCLGDRERLDARVARQWNEPRLGAAATPPETRE